MKIIFLLAIISCAAAFVLKSTENLAVASVRAEFKPMVWESFNFTELTWLPYNTNSTQYQSQSSPGQQQQSSPGQQQSSTGQQQQSSGPMSQSQSNSTGTQQQKQ